MSEHAVLMLLGIASVAIAISGFSGVVAVFAGRADGKWSAAERFRTKNMLILSLVACLLSFVPLTEELFRIPDRILWMSASLLLFAFCAAYIVYTISMLRKPILRRPGTLVMWVRDTRKHPSGTEHCRGVDRARFGSLCEWTGACVDSGRASVCFLGFDVSEIY
jgi:hypothetical protein